MKGASAMPQRRVKIIAGQRYRNHGDKDGGEKYLCLTSDQSGADMRNILSGWTFRAHCINRYEDGSIDWDYSTGGRFVN